MSALAAPRPAVAPARSEPLGPAIVVRLAAFAALALFAALQWALLEEPNSRAKMAATAALALAVSLGLWLAARPAARAARVAARAALALAAFAVLLLVAGVPLAMLDPEFWGALASGLGQGIEALPTIGIPYRGVDPWTRIVLVIGGGLLLVLGGALAVRALRRERRPLGAAVVLTTAYAIPVVVRAPDQPLLNGAVFTVLVGALLWADRIERPHVAPALMFVAVALAGGLLAQPRLDAESPWVDYEKIVESLSTPPAVGFNWEHGYGPLDWPRENRVMLRVATANPSYWKALDLETFDGTRWTAAEDLRPERFTEIAPNHAKEWVLDLRVSVRDLRSRNYITAGVGLEVSRSPRFAIASGPGTFSTGEQPLRRGDTYEATVYATNPSVRELRGAGTQYPEFVTPYVTMDLPDDVGGPTLEVYGAPSNIGPVTLQFPEFGLLSARNPPLAYDPAGAYVGEGASMLRTSQYAEAFALARRLRAASDTPYEYVTAVQAHLAAEGFKYTEKPPRPRAGRPPLVSFLFDSKQGYCQQFSGAMALLLRMGGIPARVSSGFSPGTFDDGRDEWVVRDVDAHSWVEAYFPKLGWVTFDPTPGVAPPNTQLVNGPAPAGAEEIPLRSDPRRADVPDAGAPAGGSGPGEEGTVSGWVVVLAALLAGALVAGAIVLLGARRRAQGADSQLAELERALRLTGRTIEPPLTLVALERRLGGGAREYLEALRLARFGGREQAPTPEQRAALRAELAAGLGWAGRLRAWWALPPVWTGSRPPSGLH